MGYQDVKAKTKSKSKTKLKSKTIDIMQTDTSKIANANSKSVTGNIKAPTDQRRSTRSGRVRPASKTKTATPAEDQYIHLAQECLRQLLSRPKSASVARALGLRFEDIENNPHLAANLKLTRVLLILEKLGMEIDAFTYVPLAPRSLSGFYGAVTEVRLQSRVVAPLLKEIRGDRSLKDVVSRLDGTAFSTFGHWENGRRGISFAQFLRIVDRLTMRLPALLEFLGFAVDLSRYSLESNYVRENFNAHFFRLPWTPTVYLFLVSGAFKNRTVRKESAREFFKTIGLSESQIQESLQTLFDLQLAHFERDRVSARSDFFYATPIKDLRLIQNIHEFWFQQSFVLSKLSGYHKVDQFALSKRLFKEVVQRVVMLREEIRRLAAQESPETVVHITWQIADLLNNQVKSP